MKDYYDILGVSRSATETEIKQAYRKLAMKHHPDRGGDAQRFQEIAQAYEVLSDNNRRAEYDNPGVRMRFGGGNSPQFDFGSIFEMFGTNLHAQRHRENSARLQLWVGLRDVVQGGRRPIAVSTLQGQINVEIDIPRYLEDGDTVRYPAVGPGGVDLIITFRIRPEPGWSRDGNNLMTEITVPVWQLILGGSAEVTNLSGNTLVLTIPAMTQPGTMLRLRGQGLVARHQSDPGDLLVRIQTILPTMISQDLRDHIARELGQ